MSFAVPADQPPGIVNKFCLGLLHNQKIWFDLRMMDVGDFELRTDERKEVYASWQKNRMAVAPCDLLFMKRFCLLLWQIYLSWHLLCLLKKNFTLISSVSGHDKYISCPKSYYAKFIFHSSMGQKIYLWFVLFNSFECIIVWFCAFPNFRHFTCTSFSFFLKKKERERKKADLKLNIKKTKIMTTGPITSWQIEGEKSESSDKFYFPGLQNHCRQWLKPWN